MKRLNFHLINELIYTKICSCETKPKILMSKETEIVGRFVDCRDFCDVWDGEIIFNFQDTQLFLSFLLFPPIIFLFISLLSRCLFVFILAVHGDDMFYAATYPMGSNTL